MTARLAEIVGEVISDAIAECAQLREGIGGPNTLDVIERYAAVAGDVWDEARTLHSLAQLDALPDGAIVMDCNRHPVYKREGIWWSGSQRASIVPPYGFPALLLWHPSWGATGSAHSNGVPVINLGAVVDRRGDFPGRRQHHRPHPSDFTDGLVYWSDPAERWMRVNGPYPDEELS